MYGFFLERVAECYRKALKAQNDIQKGECLYGD